jgi:bile acid-coenzyme A ligase
MASAGQPVSFGKRVTDLAAERPEVPAIIFSAAGQPEHEITWRELDLASNRAAHGLAAAGIGKGDDLVIALPNCPEHIIATYGAWKLGACVIPLRWDLPTWERDRVLSVAAPKLTLTIWEEPPRGLATLHPDALNRADLPETHLPDVVACPARAIATSGSTGVPKLIVGTQPGEGVPGSGLHNGSARFLGYYASQRQIIPAPLYHTNGFLIGHSALFEGQTVVLMDRFDPERVVDLIERYRVNVMTAVTIMLQRIARLPDINERDLSSLESVLHGGAPLPQWLARCWMDLIGPTRFFVCYGSSENAGSTLARGDTWLEHPGTVGRAFMCEVKVVRPDGSDADRGEVGEIRLRREGQSEPTFAYRGAVAATNADWFSSIGDLGWMDEEGFLYLADRRHDMIISGGSNVFAAEVEAALSEHPDIADAIVVGRPDDEWGQRVHAVVQLAVGASGLDADAVREHCKTRLAPYKVPKTVEFVERLARTDAGKIRRSDYAVEPGVPS